MKKNKKAPSKYLEEAFFILKLFLFREVRN